MDLLPHISADSATEAVAVIVSDFAHSANATGALARAQAVASRLAGPLIQALELEGSAALGKEWCNSDFPTNPKAIPFRAHPTSTAISSQLQP